MAFRAKIGGKGGVTVRNVDEAVVALKREDLTVRQASRYVVSLAGKVLADVMRSEAPTRTGRLAKSVTVLGTDTFADGREATAYVGPRLFYGGLLSEGTVYIAATDWMVSGAEKGKEPTAEAARRLYAAVIEKGS